MWEMPKSLSAGGTSIGWKCLSGTMPLLYYPEKGELTDWEIGQIQDGGLIWGCDICNDVCPMNQEAKVLTPVPEFLESAVAVLDAQIAERLLKTRAYNYRGKKTILRNIQLLEGANEDDR